LETFSALHFGLELSTLKDCSPHQTTGFFLESKTDVEMLSALNNCLKDRGWFESLNQRQQRAVKGSKAALLARKSLFKPKVQSVPLFDLASW